MQWEFHSIVALHIASARGHAAVVRLLWSRGADVNHQNSDEWTPLLEASLWGQLEAVRVLVNHKDINITNVRIMKQLYIIAA